MIIGWAESDAMRQSMMEAGARLTWSKPLPRCETLINQIFEAKYREPIDMPRARVEKSPGSKKPFVSSRINLIVESASDRSRAASGGGGVKVSMTRAESYSRLRSSSFDGLDV
jgi:hypothetical protein